MSNGLILSCLLLLPVQLFAGTAPVSQFIDSPPAATAELLNAPSGYTKNATPNITVTGNGVVSYKYRWDNGDYSQETPVEIPISFGADVAIGNQPLAAGTTAMQSYIDLRTGTQISPEFISSMVFSNVKSDTDVVYLLNPLRFALRSENVLTVQGSNIDNLKFRTLKYNPDTYTSSDLPSILIKGGNLRLLESNDVKSFRLEMPVSASNITIVANPASNCSSIFINGEKVAGSTPYQLTVADGMTINIRATFMDSTEKYYNIDVATNQSLDGSGEMLSYYFKVQDLTNDYTIIYNDQDVDVSVDIDLNYQMYRSSSELYQEVAQMTDEFSDEPLQRKAWRYIKNNRYHFPPITREIWVDSPALFFNSLGLGWCGDASLLFMRIMKPLGFTTRYSVLEGHVVPEVLVNNRWELWDPDLEVYFYNSQGMVAGIDELAANPVLVTNPINPIRPVSDYIYSQRYADIYSSPLGPHADGEYPAPMEVSSQFTLPARGRVELPYHADITLTAIDNWYPKKFANAKLTIPRDWSGTITNPLVLQSIGYEGKHSLDVIAKDSTGNWQITPTNASWTADIQPPFSNALQDLGVFNINQPVIISTNEPSSTYFTVDGTEPTIYSDLYIGPISVHADTAIKYFSVDRAGNREATKTYSQHVSNVTLTSDFSSPNFQGIVVSFTANATGGGGSFEYQFRYLDPNTNTWFVSQDYSDSKTWSWITSGFAPGIYKIEVRIRNVGEEVNYDSYLQTDYTILPSKFQLNLKVDKSSPQVTGSVITINATAYGGSGTYEYCFLLRDSITGQWSFSQAYSSNPSLQWNTNGIPAGTYTIQVRSRSVGVIEPYEANQSITFTIIPPVSDLTVTIDKPSPQQEGTVVTFAASASGGNNNYEYYFTFYNPNTKLWSIGQVYGAKSIWIWDTSGYAPGVYTIEVWTKNSGSSVNYDMYKHFTYTIIPPPVSELTVTIDKASPQSIGSKVTFTATTTGGSGNYEYYFTVRNPSSGTWSVGQAYSGKNAWTWDTAGLDTGTYTIQVWSRSSGSLSSYEVYRSTSYTINPPPPPATGMTLAMDKNTPQSIGSKVTFTATTTGGSGNYEYYFTVRKPSSGTWSVGQAYSGKNAWTWDTAGLDTGTYTIQVWSRSSGSLSSYEVYRSTSYTINPPPPPATGMTLAMDKNTPQSIGSKVTFTATTTGGSGNYEYYFTVRKPSSGTWSVGQAYSGKNAWTWDTAGLDTGTYTIQVWSRSSGSLSSYEVYNSISYALNLH